MYHDEAAPRSTKDRVNNWLDKAERIYLRALRAAILVIATLLLIYAAWLAISGAYSLSRSPDSVKEEEVEVVADDLTNAAAPTPQRNDAANAAAPAANAAQANFYRAFAKRYHDLYRRKFEPFRQQDDKQLTFDEFDDSFLNTSDRLKAISEGNLNFEEDRTDLENLLRVMSEAADKPLTKERLTKYRAAKKVAVKKEVERTRTEYRQGWDSSSMACSDWYLSPVGCSVRRAVQVPYTTVVTEMEYPAGTQSHVQLFRAFQDRYFELLNERREASASEAESERQDIIAGFVTGKISLMTALWVLCAFVALMFFFLLIAIERHQRRLAGELASREAQS